MNLYCIEDFKNEFLKLKSKKPYKNLETEIYNYFYNKKTKDFIGRGTLLNGDRENSFVKQRIKGRSGYRLYYFLFIHDENIYLGFVHPKTGPFGASNVKDWYKADIQKKILESIRTNDLYRVLFNESEKTLTFQKQELFEKEELQVE